MKDIKLRPYQEVCIAQLDDHFRRGNRKIILYCQTGSGKTTTAAWMILRAVQYEYPTMFVVRGRELVKNASETLDRYGIDHSINMAGHWRYNPKKLVQVCSIDTLKSRGNYPFTNKEPLIFLDEMHRDYSDIYTQYPDGFFIGMSATPFNDNSQYHAVVNPIEGYELRDQGFLVPEKIYCPHVIDVTAVKKVRGDYEKKQLESVVTQGKIVGNIVNDYISHGQNRSALCFAVSIEHSKQLSQAFTDAGISSMHCDASSSDSDRKKAKDGLEDGSIKVVTNVDIFSTGWDCPSLGCIIMARPTCSLIWYLQVCGRGLRSSEGKKDCIILDNAGNVFRFGTPYRIREITLDKPQKRKNNPMDNKVRTCEECFYIYDPEMHEACPECGWVPPKKTREVKSIDGKLTVYEESEKEREERLFGMMRADYYKMEWVRKTKKLKEDWTFYQLRKKYKEVFHLLPRVTVVPKTFLPDQRELPYHEFH